MRVDHIHDLTYRGEKLGASPDDFAELRPSSDALDDREELHRRMEEDGYLFLPGLLDRDEVLEARKEVMRRLQAMGAVDERHPSMEGVYRPGGKIGGMHDFTRNNPPLMNLLYDGPMMDFYTFFLGGPVRHFDYTWFRVKTPGITGPTTPHYDIVYMGRGTQQLYTSWTPLGDVPYRMGGLILLENSHRQAELKRTYGRSDVDKYCENGGEAARIVETAQVENRDLTAEERRKIRWNSTGAYSASAQETRARLGGRWLSATYQAGDLLVFCMFLMHASADNRSDRIRISSDSRYQLAAEPADDRWIGQDPPAHGIRAKRGIVC